MLKLSSAPATLAEILSGPDEFGLLENVAPLDSPPLAGAAPQMRSLDAAALNFREICEFVEATGHEPQPGARGREHLLAARLAAFRASEALAARVRFCDAHNLLPPENSPEPPASLDAILAGPDEFGLLDEVAPAPEAREAAHAEEAARRAPDEIASRPCADFARFGPHFRLTHELLKSGQATAAPWGSIYILESLSENPALARYRVAGELVKIGYSSRDPLERIKNAANDPTFLEAPVITRASLACYNLDPRRFEHLIHSFLRARRLNVELRDKNGAIYRPREWFTVNWRLAAEICRRIIDGSIAAWRLDAANGRLVRRE